MASSVTVVGVVRAVAVLGLLDQRHMLGQVGAAYPLAQMVYDDSHMRQVIGLVRG
jgi:hypothetical protein